MSEPADVELIEVLRRRDGVATEVRLRDGSRLDVFKIAWGYDDGDDWAHVTTNISPDVDAASIDVFSTQDVEAITDPESGVVVFSPER